VESGSLGVPNANYGYSTKTLLARWLDEQISVKVYGRLRYFVWFTEQANEDRNDPNANPLRIYLEIDSAVKRKDSQNAKLRLTRARMLAAIRDHLDEEDPRYGELTTYVGNADISCFAPQLWRIDLHRWTGSDTYIRVRDFEFKSTGLTLHPSLYMEVIP
jgi:hypothetical protein